MKHLEVVAGIIVFNKKILCAQRNAHKYDYLSFKFEFPGGKIEPGETRPDALMRELQEELDFTIEITESNYFQSVSYTYPDFEITMHCYLCHVEFDNITLKEHVAAKWLSTNELKTLDWAPADYPIVDELEKRGV